MSEADVERCGMVHVLSSCAPAQNTEAWLSWRRFRLTASDCPKVIGNAVKSRERLIREKKGLAEPWKGNSYTQAGHDFEGAAVAAYERLKGVNVLTSLVPVAHPNYPALAASLDGLSTEGVNVEIKCLSDTKKHAKAKMIHYHQVQYQMACASLVKTHLVYYYLKLNPQGELCDNIRAERAMQVFEIDYDAKWFNGNLPKFLQFVSELDDEPCPFT